MVKPTTTPANRSDEEIAAQAAFLAEYTCLSEREAEARLRKRLHDEDDPQYEMAEQMGVSESTFSEHLSNADDKTDPQNALKMGAMFAGQSPISPETYRKVGDGQFQDKGYIEVYEDVFEGDGNKYAPPWAVVIVRPVKGGPEEMPDDDDVRLQHRWTMDYYHFDTETEVVKTLDALVNRRDRYDKVVVRSALKDAGIDVDAVEDGALLSEALREELEDQ